MSKICECQTCFTVEQGLTLGAGTWINQFQKDATIQLNTHGNHPPCMGCDVDKMKLVNTWVESQSAKAYWRNQLTFEITAKLRERIVEGILALKRYEPNVSTDETLEISENMNGDFLFRGEVLDFIRETE